MAPTPKKQLAKKRPRRLKPAPVEGKRKRGGQTVFTAELGDAICKRLATGEGLLTICRDPKFPDEAAVRRWALDPEHEFSPRYARAREAQGYGFDDEIIDYRQQIAKGDLCPNAGRVIIDSLKWQASKCAPKRFGDKLAHVGPDDGAIQLEKKPPDKLATARWIADLLLSADAAKQAQADDDEGNPE